MANSNLVTWSTNIQVWSGTADPNGSVTAGGGSFFVRFDAGQVRMYLNTATGGSTGSVWVEMPVSGGQWTLPTGATAWSVGSAAFPSMMVFDTTGAAEQIVFGAKVLRNLNTAVRSAADAMIDAGFWLRKTYGAGASTTAYTFPVRSGGWRVADAYIQSGGATGGTVQFQTAAGAANVTNAMVPGNLGEVTRCASLANQTFASGAVSRINVAAGAPVGELFLRIEPL